MNHLKFTQKLSFFCLHVRKKLANVSIWEWMCIYSIYKFSNIFKGVRALQESKKYVLRTVNLNVNDARKDILENLKDHEILLERDWAMKFIPMQYRESQSNWCWTGILPLEPSEVEKQWMYQSHHYSHFDAATQDAHTSYAVLQNSLMILSINEPSLKEA